ncbi:MAG: microcystin degradation protein MlrC [Cereibacter sphaeroides]|uniref:Microcystinase C n=1 Tax=Cereibacter sphaeroides TaxID=1063 RepID=A0A2W5TG13_CERSP|nr:MAG: microcystin degradation protein MlrC [Cereibacter sphaeroides]
MTFRVLSAEFITENNTFKKGWTELHHFQVDTLAEGDQAIEMRGQANTELAGFLDAAADRGWEMTHVISALASPDAPVSREAYEYVAGKICAAITARKGQINGILLGLHGAQVTEFCEDGEGELLARIRAIVGPDMPIAATLDLHANATEAMSRDAQIWVSYKTYPHIDMRASGKRAGLLLDHAMSGRTKPATLRRHIPMMDEANAGRSDVGPLVDEYEKARAEELEQGILSVSLNAGFSDADIAEMGPAVYVTYDRAVPGSERRAAEIADAHARAIWDARYSCANTFLEVDQAVSMADGFDTAKGPLVIADYADNPGSGAYGDATNLLKAMLDAGLTDAVFSPMIDAEAADELHEHREGDTVTIKVGGKSDPAFGGGPLTLTGRIERLSDGFFRGDGPMLGGLDRSYGKTAVLKVEGVEILIVTEREQMLDRQQLYAFGIDPTKRKVLALKSMQHFRAAFEPIAGKVIVCDSGALSTPKMSRRPYRNVKRPIWPLDEATVF